MTTPCACEWCGTTRRIRMTCDGGGYVQPSYSCEECFPGYDDGPDWDDLGPIINDWTPEELAAAEAIERAFTLSAWDPRPAALIFGGLK